MKSALVLEKDAPSSVRTTKLLSCLGYVTAPVRSPEEALNVASAIKFDVVVTYTATKPNDRRSLTGELKRVAPEAAVVLLVNDNEERPLPGYKGVSAVLERPPSADDVRRAVMFGIDGYGLQPAYVLPFEERRKALF